jgi:predicted esterase
MLRRGLIAGLALMAAAFAGGGCGQGQVTESTVNNGGAGNTGGGSVGDNCASEPCRAGLTCTKGTCTADHDGATGAACMIADECQDGLQCVSGACTQSNGGAQGDGCRGDIDCGSGLRCTLVGFSAQCQPQGTNGVGKSCQTSSDCFAGLACEASVCATPPPGAPSFGAPGWTGVSCEAPSTGAVRAYFEVPGAQQPAAEEGDFFRLPFPNDIRLQEGKLDLSGFPTPGSDLLGFDPVQRYIDALVGENPTGWSTDPTVIFRFSGAIDFNTFKSKNGTNPVSWVDITDPTKPASAGLSWYASSGRTNYVCDNWFGIRRPQGHPMTPGHVYAVWLTTACLDANDQPIQRSPDLTALLGATAPADSALAAAYPAFAPFRAYLTAQGIDPSTVLDATVVTAQQAPDTMAALAQAVQAAPVPVAKDWVKCGGGAVSPCPQATGDRACGPQDSAYDEYDALVSLPIFQQGTAPYFDPADGGGIVTSAPVRTEDVCMALTVPKGASMPANGWPLVVYAHGTGGSYRDHVTSTVAGTLSNVALPDGSSVHFAVLGIDQVEHGPRRGNGPDSSQSPDTLFFNFANPAAARGNPLQGAADQLSLARFASTLDASAADTGGAELKVDPNAIVFLGHSQGATEGSLALPYSSTYKAAVLSGNGASLTEALLSKQNPVNIAAAVPFVLGDFNSSGGLNGGDMHPVLTLLQQWIDPADPLNFARLVGLEPPTGTAPKSVFQTYGIGDTYAPPVTLAIYAIAAGMDEATPDASVTTPDKIDSLTPESVPLSGNVTVSGTQVTLAVREYAPPSGTDGHFVLFETPSANADAARFLGMAAAGELPQVGK